jgi:hypothetical protein
MWVRLLAYVCLSSPFFFLPVFNFYASLILYSSNWSNHLGLKQSLPVELLVPLELIELKATTTTGTATTGATESRNQMYRLLRFGLTKQKIPSVQLAKKRCMSTPPPTEEPRQVMALLSLLLPQTPRSRSWIRRQRCRLLQFPVPRALTKWQATVTYLVFL